MPDTSAILIHFLPELILALGALVVLLYDLVARGRGRGALALAAATLVLSLGATLWLYTVPAPATATATGIGASAGVACPPGGIFETRSAAPGSAVLTCGDFVADSFTRFFRLLGTLTALLVVLTGQVFMGRRTPFRGEFFALLLLATLAMNLMAGASDLILIALSIEFLSITSYVLTGFLREEPLSIEGGLKYFLYGSVAGAVMLFGLSLLYGLTGSTSVPAVAAVLSDPERTLVGGLSGIALPAILLVLVGMGFKIALVPFHQWSPDAYQGAPTPVTAFLSVGPKVAGFAVLLRLFVTAFGAPSLAGGWLPVVAAIAVLTMVFGNVVALSQNDVKRMMAYSSIAQAGYVLVGLAVLGTAARHDGLAAVLVYLLAYLFTNLGVFAVIVAVDEATASSDISAFDGLMRRSPVLGAALAVFLLSLLGIPPLGGFIGKFAVFRAAVDGGQAPLAVVGVLTGVISVGYYFRILRAAFFTAPPTAGPLRMAPGIRAAIVIALVMTLAIGLYAGPFLQLASDAAAGLAPVAAPLAGAGG